jgi:hypothetical protein
MGDENENRALQISEGLATRQQQLAQLLTQLITTNQNHGGNNDNGGTIGHNRGNNGAGVSLGIMETMLREITIRFQHRWVLEPQAV